MMEGLEDGIITVVTKVKTKVATSTPRVPQKFQMKRVKEMNENKHLISLNFNYY